LQAQYLLRECNEEMRTKLCRLRRACLKSKFQLYDFAQQFKYGVCDFLYGYYFYDINPVDAYELMVNKKYLVGYSEGYRELYSAVAISEYRRFISP